MKEYIEGSDFENSVNCSKYFLEGPLYLKVRRSSIALLRGKEVQCLSDGGVSGLVVDLCTLEVGGGGGRVEKFHVPAGNRTPDSWWSGPYVTRLAKLQ